MTANDPTGALTSEWSYGFPNGEVEEGKPGPLPQRTPGATTPAALKPGTRVQAILLDRNDDALVDLPGMQGAVVPVSEWPAALPDEWTDENTLLVRWDDPERLRFTPYRPDVAARVLRVLDDAPTPRHYDPDAAPLSDRTLAKVLSRPAYEPRDTPSLVEMDRREAAERALAALVEWRKAGDVKAHIHATVALRKAADEYIEVTS